jgi:predicted transcriptional regulator
MPKPKSTSLKILSILAQNNLATVPKIAERLKANHKTIASLIKTLKTQGYVSHYKNIRGLYTITEEGKRLISESKQIA